MGIRLWVKEQVAKLRRKQDDDEDSKHRQLQNVDGAGNAARTRGCSVLFARARKHHDDQKGGRRKARSRSHPARVSETHSEASEARSVAKPCVVCEKPFQANTSKYLDYCSTECKTKAFMEKGTTAEAPSRASEWI